MTCTDCEAIVCPRCMVECPVGNRCKKCAAKTESHVLKVTPLIALRTFLGSALASYLFSYISPFTGAWFYSWIIVYFLGVILGGFLHKLAAYKLGGAIVSVVLAGIVAGAILNPQTIAHYDYSQAIYQELAEDTFDDKAPFDGEATGATGASGAAKSAGLERREKISEAVRDAIAQKRTEQMQAATQTIQFWQMVKLTLFTVGILTPFIGIVPPFPVFPFRR